MAITTKTPQQVADEYLLHLKTLKPQINTDQTDSDWWVRSRVVGGTVAGVYADVRKISTDAFPQSARREALEQHLITYFGGGFKPATEAVGNVSINGVSGATISIGQSFFHTPTGKEYTATQNFTLSGPTGSVPVQSILTGQAQNLLAGTQLEISPAPSGITSPGVVIDPGLTDARDEETNDEAAARILARIRSRIRGGTETDYQQWAIEADISVVSATVLKFPFGLGTVQVIVTAGTTDIDNAIDSDQPITLLPSGSLLTTVKNYIDSVNPLTDCVSVSGPTPVLIDVSVSAHFVSGNISTVITDLGITQGEAIEREVKRAIYKTPIGGRIISGTGYVLASEIEEMIDYNLSSTPYTVGVKKQIVIDRQVGNLSASGANISILANQVAIPGTITVVDF